MPIGTLKSKTLEDSACEGSLNDSSARLVLAGGGGGGIEFDMFIN